ncbi:hypothetical protein [Methylomonas albis]|uniref:CBM-cenC domain-containing protein n=1 Tax=Methylomonas albis TaxID=1854563 RepID=A0ABR9CZL5_9GAMM|nr:carbohydrate binding domain-containing protein [Methylomonas albis]MBD9355986.1 hypothetical protein [Methylomonas albis]CAD6879026.1 hypothetical protein [Methylomonas albis]
MKLTTGLCVGLAMAVPAVQANLVANGNFEQPASLAAVPGYQYLPNNDTSVMGWTSISDGIGEESYLMNKNRSNGSYVPRVYEGIYGLALNTGNAIQTSVSLVAGTTYDLSFWARANVSGASPLQIEIAGNSLTMANAVTFTQFIYHFNASAADSSALLKFFNPSTSGGNRVWALDAISLEAAPVPLPAATWTFLSGLMGFLALSKRKALAA